MAAPRCDVVVVVEVVGAGAGGGGGATWIADWPRVNGSHTGGSFGSGKSYTCEEPRALSMKSFQRVAGNVAPWTLRSVGIPSRCAVSATLSGPTSRVSWA